MIWLLGYLCKSGNIVALSEYVKVATMLSTLVNSFIILVGWSVWFYAAQFLWADVDSGGCLEGLNLLDFINLLLLLLVTVWPAVFFAILLLTCCCWLPKLKEYFNEINRANEAQR